MRITDFDIYKDLLKEKSGLILTPDKSYLLESRLGPIAKKWGYASLEAMTIALHGVPDKKLVYDVVEAMTYGDTSFFRDVAPFETFSNIILPDLVKKNAAKKTARVWCAGSSSGQEPYSLVISFKEKSASMPGWKLDILATDISNETLDLARAGIFSQFEVQRGLSFQTLLKHFAPFDKGKWKLSDELRKMVRHEYFNLMDSPSKLGTFDVILCRNVISYFDDKTKKSVLEKLAGQLEKNGFLFLGETESALGLTDALKPVPGVKGLFIHKDSKFEAPLASAAISA